MKRVPTLFLLAAFISLVLNSCGNFQPELQKLHSAAERGDSRAMALLGHRYMVGDGVPIDYTEALKWFEKGSSQETLACENCLAWLLATCPDDLIRDGNRAVIIGEKVVANDRSAANMDTLAAAYAEVGNFGQAIRTQEEAISKLSSEDKNRLAQYRDRLESYKNNEPWRKP